MLLNPFKLIHRHERLRQAVQEEVWILRRIHGDAAHAAALEKLQRSDLTRWGRKVVKGAAKELQKPWPPGGA